ncbi:MAG: hypothetical protein LAT52_09325, partial [Balneolales bacterium]|nr:hypothetical protein [Balneolales bacterium]
MAVQPTPENTSGIRNRTISVSESSNKQNQNSIYDTLQPNHINSHASPEPAVGGKFDFSRCFHQ